MTAPKRWYQLSILQILVAMAVVAVFTFQNTSYQLSNAKDGIGLIGAGWPFKFLYGFGMLATTTSEFVRAGDPILAGMPNYNPWILTLDIALCCLTTFLAVKTIAFMTRKSKP